MHPTPTDQLQFAEGSRFGSIPNELLLDPTISCGAKALYCLLHSYVSGRSGQAFPSQGTLATYLGVTRPHVSRKLIPELKCAGWISVSRREDGESLLYTVHWVRPNGGTLLPERTGVCSEVTGGVCSEVTGGVTTEHTNKNQLIRTKVKRDPVKEKRPTKKAQIAAGWDAAREAILEEFPDWRSFSGFEDPWERWRSYKSETAHPKAPTPANAKKLARLLEASMDGPESFAMFIDGAIEREWRALCDVHYTALYGQQQRRLK